jgi:DNA polymerase type B, organellar and viral
LEALKYLRGDVEGLFEVIKLISHEFFDKFSLNISSFYTLPGLTIAAYFSNYHNSDHQIKMIKGQVEKDIRSAYHGGVINVYNTLRSPQGAGRSPLRGGSYKCISLRYEFSIPICYVR